MSSRKTRPDAPARHPAKPPVVGDGEGLASRRIRRILDDLETLFLADGFMHLTTDDIARKLRCSKATLYRLARTRDDIYAKVVHRFLDKVHADGLQSARAASSWSDALVGFLGAGVRGAREVSWAFVRDMRRHPGARRLLMSHQRQRVAELERLIEAGLTRGGYRALHARLVAELLLPMMAKVFEPEFLTSVGLSLAQAYEEAYRMVEYGLIPQDSVRAPARKRSAHARKAASDERVARQLAKLW